MFRGKQRYRFLNRRSSHCIENYCNETDFIVQFCDEEGRSYLMFESCDSFYSWYRHIPDIQKTFFEVIREGTQKFRIDIDDYVEDIDFLVSRVRTMFLAYGLENPRILLYDIEKSYHLVLSNYSFISNKHCESLARIILKEFNIDMGVYKKTQHFRIEGCTKYGQKRWKRRVGRTLTSESFHEGIISDVRNTNKIMSELIPRVYNNEVGKRADIGVPLDFKIRRTEGHVVFLDRIRPSFCLQCKRIHDNENAYIYKNNFYCWRWVSFNKF